MWDCFPIQLTPVELSRPVEINTLVGPPMSTIVKHHIPRCFSVCVVQLRPSAVCGERQGHEVIENSGWRKIMMRKHYLTVLATLAIATGGLWGSTLAHATDQADQRQESRDVKQEGREGSREAKEECKEGDEKSRNDCRQDKRDTKQDSRDTARDVKY
jgi:hypothetical protein